MSFLSRIFGERRERARLRPLYERIVALARDPAWYRQGGVPDTVDGRFNMVSSLVAIVLLRLEAAGSAANADAALLTELFVADMDSSLRQIGIGDFVVAKHVGRLVGALGGRLGAFRTSLRGDKDFADAVRRNIFPETAPAIGQLDCVAGRLADLDRHLAALPLPQVLSGDFA